MNHRERIIAITNRKGGSGKTTSVVNIAVELVARGYRVLVVDLDPQDHVAIGLGVTEPSTSGSHVIFAGGESRLPGLIRSSPVGVDVVPADSQFDSSHTGKDWHCLRRALNQSVFDDYDYILIDTPPSMDAVLMNVLVASGSVLIPLIPHYLAATGVRELSRLFVNAALSGGHRPRLLGILPVMVDRRVRLQQSVLNELSSEFGVFRVMRGIRSDIRLAEAFGKGRPVRDFAPRSRGAMDYFIAVDALLKDSPICLNRNTRPVEREVPHAIQGGL